MFNALVIDIIVYQLGSLQNINSPSFEQPLPSFLSHPEVFYIFDPPTLSSKNHWEHSLVPRHGSLDMHYCHTMLLAQAGHQQTPS